jgi:hypothetical protein
MKFWGDDEHPKERLCPKNYSLKLATTPGIANPCQEHYDLGFICRCFKPANLPREYPR